MNLWCVTGIHYHKQLEFFTEVDNTRAIMQQTITYSDTKTTHQKNKDNAAGWDLLSEQQRQLSPHVDVYNNVTIN